MGTKSRTLKSYSLIGMAVKYIYNANEETFLELGHPWEEMLQEFLPGRFKEAVRLTHPDISRPDLMFKNFLQDLGKYAGELTISQVGQSQVMTFHSKFCVGTFVTNCTCNISNMLDVGNGSFKYAHSDQIYCEHCSHELSNGSLNLSICDACIHKY